MAEILIMAIAAANAAIYSEGRMWLNAFAAVFCFGVAIINSIAKLAT